MQAFTRKGRFEDLKSAFPFPSSLHAPRSVSGNLWAGEPERPQGVIDEQDFPLRLPGKAR
jgi:hypothetical protein